MLITIPTLPVVLVTGTTTDIITPVVLTAKFYEPADYTMIGITAAMSMVPGHIASKGEGSTTAPQQDQCRFLFLAGISGSLDFLPNLAL